MIRLPQPSKEAASNVLAQLKDEGYDAEAVKDADGTHVVVIHGLKERIRG